jgi:hypothetical protein
MAVYRCTGDLHVLPRTYGRVRAFVDCAGDGNSQGVRYRCEPCLYGGRPLGTSKVHAAPISQVVVPIAEERGLKIMQIEPMPFIIDALWTSRKYADENPQVMQNVVRAYTRAIAVLVKDREKSWETLRKIYANLGSPDRSKWLRAVQRRIGPRADTIGEGDQEHIRDKPTSCAEARRYRHQALPVFRPGAALGG